MGRVMGEGVMAEGFEANFELDLLRALRPVSFCRSFRRATLRVFRRVSFSRLV